MKKKLLVLFAGLLFAGFATKVKAQLHFDEADNIFTGNWQDLARDVSVLNNNANYKIYVGDRQQTANNYDGLVMAHDHGENLKWYISIEGAGTDEVLGVDTRTTGVNSGDIYITGFFTGTAKLVLHDGFPIHHFTTTLTTLSAPSGVAQDQTYFLTKLNQNGGHVWTQLAGTPIAGNYNTENGNDVKVSVVGGNVRVHTTGFFRGTQCFYSGATPLFTVSASANGNAIFTAQYTDNGATATCDWVSTINDAANNRHDYGYGVATDPSDGDVFITGSIGGNATVGGTVMTVSGSDDAIVVKYNSSGTPEWVTNFGGNGTSASPSDQGRSIDYKATPGSNMLYVTGYYLGSGTFANWTTTYPSAFAVKVADQGTAAVIGSKNTIIGTGSTVGYRNCISADNSTWYVVGSMTGNATIRHGGTPAGTFTNAPGASAPNADGFVIAFNNGVNVTLADYRWVAGDDGADAVLGVTDIGSGKAYICGHYRSWFCWDENVEINLANTIGGTSDGFKAIYSLYGFRPAADPTGLNSFTNEEANYKVFPNPTSGKLILHQENDAEVFVDVTDISGRLVKQTEKWSSKDISLDISDLNAGVYYIGMSSETKKGTIKIVKQ